MGHKHSTTPQARKRRQRFLEVPCDYCGAAAGERCTGAHGQIRYAVHAARMDTSRNGVDPLEQIRQIMSGRRWDADTLEAIAEVMRKAGYNIDDVVEEDDEPLGP